MQRLQTLTLHLTAGVSASSPSTSNNKPSSGPKKIGTTEEGAAVARGLGGGATSDDEDPYAIEAEFVDLDHLGSPMVGTDADLAEDYVAGLNLMASRCDPVTKMGYVDTVESGHILMVIHPRSVMKVLTTSVQHFLGGLR
jgi:hypothetical protein